MSNSNTFVSNHLTFVDLSLSRIRSFLNKIENPQDKIKNIIHVAGTNGKGSTCAFLKSILEAQGFTVNVFTSPHLVFYNERFRLNNKLISNEYLEEIKARLAKVEGYKELTIFELTMVIGFVAFFEKKADYTIIEVGLGGRLDASNVIKSPLISVITTIDYDHQNFLGNTLQQIAYEKAGIIKKNSFVITDYQKKEVIRVIKKYSSLMQASLICGGIDYTIDFNNKTNPILKYKDKIIELFNIGLIGDHQYYNASLAIVSCISILKDSFDYNKLPLGLEKVEWKGRLQKVSSLYGVDFNNSDVYLDGAHNISGSRSLCNFIEKNYNQDTNISIFIGMLLKKDLDGFLQNISKLKYKFKITIYPVEIQDHDSYLQQDIIKKLNTFNLKGKIYKNIGEELLKINSSNGKNLIVICGSLYLLGKILKDNLPS